MIASEFFCTGSEVLCSRLENRRLKHRFSMLLSYAVVGDFQRCDVAETANAKDIEELKAGLAKDPVEVDVLVSAFGKLPGWLMCCGTPP